MDTQELINETITKIQEGAELDGIHYVLALMSLEFIGLDDNKRNNNPLDSYQRYSNYNGLGREFELLKRHY